jgi:hypothetical protein
MPLPNRKTIYKYIKRFSGICSILYSYRIGTRHLLNEKEIDEISVSSEKP